jgi:hypothetical protein
MVRGNVADRALFDFDGTITTADTFTLFFLTTTPALLSKIWTTQGFDANKDGALKLARYLKETKADLRVATYSWRQL